MEVEVGEAVAVPDGLGVNVGRGEGVKVDVEAVVGLTVKEKEGIKLGDTSDAVASGWFERVRKKIETINKIIINPNPANKKRNKGGRSGSGSGVGVSVGAEVI